LQTSLERRRCSGSGSGGGYISGRAGVETLGLRRDPAADTTTSEVSRDPH